LGERNGLCNQEFEDRFTNFLIAGFGIVGFFPGKLHGFLKFFHTLEQLVDAPCGHRPREFHGSPESNGDILVIDLDLRWVFSLASALT
jgi:hypothetical protein